MKTVDFDDETTMLHANGDRTTSEKKSKHKHKEKKSKKKTKKEKGIGKDSRAVDIELNHRSTKRKRSESMDHEEKSGKTEQKKPKKSKKDKRKKEKRTRRDDGDDEEPSNVASTQRLVASSAIEFYDESLKEKVKLRTKIGIGDINEEKEDVLATGQNVLKKTICVSESTTRPRADSKNDDDNMASDNDRQKQQIINKLIKEKKQKHSLTLLLFYQYVEPKWDQSTYDYMLSTLQHIGTDLKLTGRMRVAREGLNCTLTGSHESIVEYCNTLRRLSPPLSESSLSWKGSDNTDNEKRPPKYPFENTEFKLTTDLPEAQRFPNLKVLKVVELVHYGLEGKKAPPIHKYHGTHLEPADYHKKIAEPNTVIIDVRNHYEAAIGRFVPPQEVEGQSDNQHQSSKHDKRGPSLSKTSTDLPPPKWLDPKMRKSTEFPQWLDRPETKEEMKGKQVLMYCTGGIRCERASALLKYKMETDPEIQALGIKGVYQLQGGIDKYFKEFPDGGHWRGKNYVFDKRFAHAPPKIDGELHGRQKDNPEDEDLKNSSSSNAPSNDARGQPTTGTEVSAQNVMGKCEACSKPWDMYRGKRRCPTCGVPSLICKECFLADKEGRKKLGKNVRCDLCVEQGIFSKRDLRMRDEQAIRAYEEKMKSKGLLQPEKAPAIPENPGNVTRLLLKNMCRKKMTKEALLEAFPQISHIVWKTDRKSGDFLGSAWVEMKTPDDAARAVAQDGHFRMFGRIMGICFQPPNPKDVWPPQGSAVV